MTIPHTVSIGDIPVSAWANGRGETVELARRPTTGPFVWRLSMATISEAAAFSPLPGVARVLLAVDGPLTLTIDGETHELARSSSSILAWRTERKSGRFTVRGRGTVGQPPGGAARRTG